MKQFHQKYCRIIVRSLASRNSKGPRFKVALKMLKSRPFKVDLQWGSSLARVYFLSNFVLSSRDAMCIQNINVQILNKH